MMVALYALGMVVLLSIVILMILLMVMFVLYTIPYIKELWWEVRK